ncbi:hypothetical protein NN561_019369 [Cricetulus griseus]
MEASAPIPAANRSSVLEFLLLGVTRKRGLQLLLFGVLLVTYTLTLLGNLLIVALTLADRRLHTPMYFFLRHFSLLEVGFTSTVSPQMLAHLLAARGAISRHRCFAQMILYFTLGAVETLLLAVMSTDRFLAICWPLRYPALMTPRVCSSLVLACWAASLLALPGLFAWMLSLPFCGPRVLNHFFCDSSPLLELICADTRLLQLVAFLVAVCTLLIATLITALSYGCILSTILRLPAAGGRSKAFSTCSSHILVVSLTYGSCIIMLRKCQLEAAAGREIASVLCNNSHLVELDLTGNPLKDLGLKLLCQGLRHPACKLRTLCLSLNQTLTELDLGLNDLGDPGVLLLCEGLRHPDCKLQTLRLGICRLGSDACAGIARVLQVNSCLRELDLSFNDLGDRGLWLLGEGLRHPACRLQKLWLDSCGLTSKAGEDLSSILGTNQSLTELYVTNNALGDTGVRMLCRRLRHPSCKLRVLW